MSLTIVGSVAFDEIETPYGNSGRIIGGAGTYTALAASYFAEKMNLISVVGGDFPNNYLEMLRKHRIDTDGIQKIEGKKTFFWHGRYHKNMNIRDTLATELNVLGEFDPIIPKSYQDTEFLMLGNLLPTVQSKVISRLKKRPKLIVTDTMNFWMDTMMDDLLETIKLTDVLVINDEEARQLSGEDSLIKAAKKIRKLGPDYLIVKKGEHGALLFYGEKIFHAPALPLEDVYDPTGAGDSFAGGFIGYLTKTGDTSFDNMKRAVIIGSAMASFNVEAFGTRKLQFLPEEELRKRIKAFKDLVFFDIEDYSV